MQRDRSHNFKAQGKTKAARRAAEVRLGWKIQLTLAVQMFIVARCYCDSRELHVKFNTVTGQWVALTWLDVRYCLLYSNLIEVATTLV
jgi:hypothetical protein